jgi:hypothetical protein
VADNKKPFSEIVRDYGQRQADNALSTADEWRTWAEQLDELIRQTPNMLGPWVYAEDGELSRVEMGASHVDRAAIRRRLYRVLADADAAAAALTRAAVVAENRTDELANAFAIDEAEEMLVPTEAEPVAENGVIPGHRPCPECSAPQWKSHDSDCPTLVPVVVNEDGTPATLDALGGR